MNPSQPQSPVTRDIFWGPLAAGALLLAIGLLGILANEPLLFPSLGPTAFLQAQHPEMRMSGFYNTVVGHLIGLISGVLSVLVLHAELAPSALGTGQLTPVRIFASALAITLTIAIGQLLRASHPPASATTLLVALGGFRLTFQTMLVVVAGILLIGILGGVLRRVRLAHRKE